MTPHVDKAILSGPLEIWNCLNCRRRKVRCDRHQPCAPCLRKNLQCTFPNSGRLPHRNRIPDNAKPPARKRVELLTRLRRLEAMVGDLSSQVEDASVAGDQKLECESEASMETRESSSDASNPSTTYVSESSDGELVVGDPFWSIFCKEVEYIFEAVNGPTAIDLDKHMNTNVGSEKRLSYYDFLRTHTSAASNMAVLRPLPSQMSFLWQIYVDNIDPFIKILHKPTIANTLHSLKGGFESLGSSTEALLLVVALAAAATLTDEEILLNFNAEKSKLVSDYKFTAESALAKADIISNPDLVLLQSYAIYLSVIEHTTPAGIVWRLNGVLLRAAVSLGIHRDDTPTTKSPLQIEHHRRLWWQICLLDSTSGSTHLAEFSLSENMFNTNLPINVDDKYLQESTECPRAIHGYTDTSIFLLRCHIWKFCQNLRKHPADSNPRTLINSLHQFRDSIQKSHLVHFQANEHIHRFAQTTTRLFLNRIELTLQIRNSSAKSHSFLSSSSSSHDGAQTSHDEKLLDLSTSIIEDIHALQHEPHWKQWRWQIKGTQPPWRCLHSVLDHLHKNSRALMMSQHHDRALSAVTKSLQSTPNEFRGHAQYQQLSRLLVRVEESRSLSLSLSAAEVTSSANTPLAALGEACSLSMTLPVVVRDPFFEVAADLDGDPMRTLRANLDATVDSAGDDVDFSFALDDQSWDFAGTILDMDVNVNVNVDGAAMWDPWDFGGL